MENIYVQFDSMVLQQIVGINCAPLIADLFFYCYEFYFKPPKFQRYDLIDKLNDGANNVAFSSPEPKAQVSYCHSAPSVVRPSSSSVYFSHFQLLLQNRLMDFDETW